jgi:alpha-beta hydrolase superfamily lysophospholipase
MPHDARELESGGARLHFQVWRPDGTPRATVLLVHGQGDHGSRYAHLGQAVTDAGYALAAVDIRGNGRSSGQRGDAPSYPAMLADIECAVREARPIAPTRHLFLLGHSMGGQLVTNYVIRGDVSLTGVILSSPWFRLALNLPRWKVGAGRLLAHVRPTYTYANTLTSAQLSRDASFRDAVDPDRLGHGRLTARLAAQLIDGGEAALRDAGVFDLSLLVLQAGRDTVVDPRASEQFAERAGTADRTFKLYPESHHELLHDRDRERVIADILAWIEPRL